MGILSTDEQQWDEFVLANGGNFLQSWGWSEFQAAAGREVRRFLVSRSGSLEPETADRREVVAQFADMESRLMGLSYSYIPGGPVLSGQLPGDQAPIEPLEAFLAAWRGSLRRRRQVFGRVDFFALAAGSGTAADLSERGFLKVRDRQPADTSVVDLRPDEDGLLQAMHQKTRYNIRVAARHGVAVREASGTDTEDLSSFWRLMAETSGRDGFGTHPRSYYEMMLKCLAPERQAGLTARLFLAEIGGRAVAAALTAEYGDTVTYLHGASSSECRSAMGPYGLHWEIIRRARTDGFVGYDLWGVAPEGAAAGHAWAGITRFKAGFGGNTRSHAGTWEFPASRSAYALYRLARKFRGI